MYQKKGNHFELESNMVPLTGYDAIDYDLKCNNRRILRLSAVAAHILHAKNEASAAFKDFSDKLEFADNVYKWTTTRTAYAWVRNSTEPGHPEHTYTLRTSKDFCRVTLSPGAGKIHFKEKLEKSLDTFLCPWTHSSIRYDPIFLHPEFPHLTSGLQGTVL